ncbi:hypothetical protein ASPCAL08266 [Aspergillus calidoustus]|uniref:Uncharacterized protein n=1 Tax=Aspergillus calidoustus TaxID=454130 RepID=A0A0U5CQ58_ASPCI|nr:hypothetical protein ASPCAL08266 [Aspergillus calidoustus]
MNQALLFLVFDLTSVIPSRAFSLYLFIAPTVILYAQHGKIALALQPAASQPRSVRQLSPVPRLSMAFRIQPLRPAIDRLGRPHGQQSAFRRDRRRPRCYRWLILLTITDLDTTQSYTLSVDYRIASLTGSPSVQSYCYLGWAKDAWSGFLNRQTIVSTGGDAT